MTVINFEDHRPTDPIAVFTLARSAGGEMLIYPTWCDEDWIKKFPDISSRFRELACLVADALPFLEDSAAEFEEKE